MLLSLLVEPEKPRIRFLNLIEFVLSQDAVRNLLLVFVLVKVVDHRE